MGNACCADDANRNDAQNNFKAANGVEDSTFKQNKKRGAMHGVDMDDNLTQEKNYKNTAPVQPENPEMHKPQPNVAQLVQNHNQLNPDVDVKLRELGPQMNNAPANCRNLPFIGPYKYQSTGETYQGQYRNGKREGFGKSIMSDGTLYEGSWMNDMKNGQGRIIHTDGSMFIGSWMNDKPNGQGKLVYKDGNGYTGSWENGNITGKGSQTWPDGTKYEGEFKNGLKHGNGVFTWPDGNKYDGQYKDDMRDGYGIFYWNTGQRYEGYWMAGVQHGNGKMINPQGQEKAGKWEKGKNVQWFDKASTGGNMNMNGNGKR